MSKNISPAIYKKVVFNCFFQLSLYNQITIRFFGTLETSSSINLSSANVEEVLTPGNDVAQSQIRTINLQLDANLGRIYQARAMINQESLVKIFKVRLP